jgi:glycosyltransferase involved in cell wall biosynthesis
VLLEAMRLGKPVVACAVGGMPEIVVDGETGLLVPPNDPPRLAEALARLCSDAPLRRAMGTAASARFERLYRLDRCVERTEEFYAEIIEASGRTLAADSWHARTTFRPS